MHAVVFTWNSSRYTAAPANTSRPGEVCSTVAMPTPVTRSADIMHHVVSLSGLPACPPAQMPCVTFGDTLRMTIVSEIL